MILERFQPAAGDIVQVPEPSLRQTVTALFEKVGLPPEDGSEGADVLVTTDLRGVESHGVSNRLRTYLHWRRRSERCRGLLAEAQRRKVARAAR
jgi:LDH2 family malate/lactate/ureidoglycolate dehydrogenase